MKVEKNDFKIYIIGLIPRRVSGVVLKKFINAQFELERNNYSVFNPIINMVDTRISREEAFKRNIKELLNSDSIYVINDPVVLSSSEELRIALKTNKTIIHQVVHIE